MYNRRREPRRIIALPVIHIPVVVGRGVILYVCIQPRQNVRIGARYCENFYMTAHFSLSLAVLLLCTGCNDTERFFSRVRRSRNRASTL